MKNRKFNSVVLFIPLILAFSCTSLKHVNDFSSASEKSLASYSDLPYSYTQRCLDKCMQDQELEILKRETTFNPNDTLTCDCTKNKSKDADAAKAYTILILYFTGLEKLSDGGQFIYKSDDLVNAMTKIKAINDPNIAEPVSSIADVVFNMATTVYREHALEQILNKAKDPVGHLLDDLIENNIILDKEYQGYYSTFLRIMATKYASSTHVDSVIQMNDFISNTTERDKMKAVHEKLMGFNDLLRKIKAGHDKLADERMKLKDKDLITYLYTQASQLRTNISKL
jgi:hypothetical protein